MKGIGKSALLASCILAAFVLWTVAICLVDVRAIGPQGSSVGFAGINGIFHTLTGVHWLTDIVGAALLSAGLVMMYDSLSKLKWSKRR